MQFRALLFGDHSAETVLSFWRHVKSLPAWESHPSLAVSDSVLGMTAPCTVHGDGAEIFKSDEYFVYSWSTPFCSEAVPKDPLLLKYAIALIAEREILDASAPRKKFEKYAMLIDFGYRPRVFNQVKKGVPSEIAKIIAWSLDQCAKGRFPETGYYGESFDRSTFRSSLAGSEIAGGHRSFGPFIV